MKTYRFSFLQAMANSIKTSGLYLSLFFLFTLSLVQGQNVGIGIANPQVPLHVYKTGTNEVIRLQTNDPNSSGFLSIYNANEGKGFLGLFGHPDNVKLGTYSGSTGKLQFVTNGNDIRMSILSDGNVGIGTETPTELLHLAGNLNLSGQIKANGVAGQAGEVLQSDGTGSMSWVTVSGAGSSDLLVDADGDTKIHVVVQVLMVDQALLEILGRLLFIGSPEINVKLVIESTPKRGNLHKMNYLDEIFVF